MRSNQENGDLTLIPEDRLKVGFARFKDIEQSGDIVAAGVAGDFQPSDRLGLPHHRQVQTPGPVRFYWRRLLPGRGECFGKPGQVQLELDSQETALS